MSEAWLHLHLPRYRAYLEGGSCDVISLKVPGETIRYVPHALLRNARFYVSEKGRERCIREDVRNVHAWVVGELVGYIPGPGYKMRRAVYCPWKGSTFVDLETKEPVHEARQVMMFRETVLYN
jgi:hypothetical protein